jgi:putrescine transport system substrate-binding protein
MIVDLLKILGRAILVIQLLFLPTGYAQNGKAAITLDDEKILNFSNWPDYIPETFISDFEKLTGIKVNYKLFESNEELQKRVESNTGIDDLVVPGLGFAKEHKSRGLYQPLNRAWLPNHSNLDPEFMGVLEKADPKNQYFIPWGWGFTTLYINKTAVERALKGNPVDTKSIKLPALPFPENAWDLVFNPRYSARLRSCGIGMLESPSEIMPIALLYMKKDPFSQKPQDYEEAARMLKPVRADVRIFSNTMIDVIASEKVCAAIAWSGDIRTAIDSLREKGSKDNHLGLLPSIGTTRFIDVLAIPTNAKHPKNAHAFINFYLDAIQSAKMPNEVGFANGNLKSIPYVEENTKKNPMVFPGTEYSRLLVGPDSYTVAVRWAMMQSFMAFAFRLDFNK